MQQRVTRRYSTCFKRQVVEDLENGRFETIEAARQHYGIGGMDTIPRWLARLGKNHLKGKVVRVEKPNEADQIRALKRQVKELEQALGRTQADKVLHEQYLNLACEQMGEDAASFKKKVAGMRSTAERRARPRT